MLSLQISPTQEFHLSDASLGLDLVFHCSANIGTREAPATDTYGPWEQIADATWEARHAQFEVVQQVRVVIDAKTRAATVHHRFENRGTGDIVVQNVRTVAGRVEFAQSPGELGYLHTLNVRHGLKPLATIDAKKFTLHLGRVTYPFFDGLAIWQGEAEPCAVMGPLTQNVVHRTLRMLWDGARVLELRSQQELRGIPGKIVAGGDALELDGVYCQFRGRFDANAVFEDYLSALREANGTRWEKNPLRREHFHAPWNNYLYWETSEEEILRLARNLKHDFPRTVPWVGVDDGYQTSWVNPVLPRRADGSRIWSRDVEMIWASGYPGVSFGFPDGGLGVDPKKFPRGILATARDIAAKGQRTMLWVGMVISIHHPLYRRHPDWFLPVFYGNGAILDISVPEVREQLEHVFRTYFGAGGWQALKLDFWTHLFERPDVYYRQGNRTAAEWRRWFFEMLRTCLPDDGFISLGCDLSAGAPWLSPWVDSCRISDDARDGDWETVKSNIRWSAVPVLTHGYGQPIGDADSVSIFKGLSLAERTCWADYSHQVGSIVEIGGDLDTWSAEDKAWMRRYLDEPRGGQRCWIGDPGAWRRDGLPRVVSRWREMPGGEKVLITSLHNWGDEEIVLQFRDWCGPVREHTRYENLRTGERGELWDAASFRLPARTSVLLATR